MRICPRKQRSVTWPGVWQVLHSSHLQPRVWQLPFTAREHLLMAGKSAWLWGGGRWCCQSCVPRNPRQIPGAGSRDGGGSVAAGSRLRGVVSTQLCPQQLSGDEFHQQESCSYKFNFESDPSTTANVFRVLDLLEVNSVSASEQRAQPRAGRAGNVQHRVRKDSHVPGFTQGHFHGLNSTKCLVSWVKSLSLVLKNYFSLILEHVLIGSLETFRFWRAESSAVHLRMWCTPASVICTLMVETQQSPPPKPHCSHKNECNYI